MRLFDTVTPSAEQKSWLYAEITARLRGRHAAACVTATDFAVFAHMPYHTDLLSCVCGITRFIEFSHGQLYFEVAGRAVLPPGIPLTTPELALWRPALITAGQRRFVKAIMPALTLTLTITGHLDFPQGYKLDLLAEAAYGLLTGTTRPFCGQLATLAERLIGQDLSRCGEGSQ